MTALTPPPAVLIAGFSGRALAQSARRAGFAPLVFDAYGDLDTQAAATATRSDATILVNGFRAKPTNAAFDALLAQAGVAAAPVVLGSGFEATPKLIANLETRFAMLGCASKTVRMVKNPETFFGALKDLGIPHPETVTSREPSDRATDRSWLAKRIGGMGGLHIAPISEAAPLLDRHYAQEHRQGIPVSATALVAGGKLAFAFTQSWLTPTDKAPFRFGGIVGGVSPDTDLETRLIDTMISLAKTFQLKGLVAFDFLIEDGEALLLEINPRPTAALDVLDDAQGTLFKGHVAACRDDANEAMRLIESEWHPATKAMAYLYADDGPLIAPEVDWPDWVADRPPAGTAIEANAALLTVTATADTPADAVRRTQQRLEEMARLVYDTSKTTRKPH